MPQYSKANWKMLRDDFDRFGKTLIATADNLSIQHIWDEFEHTYNDLVNKHIPKKLIKCDKDLPYITKDIKQLVKNRDKAFIKSYSKKVLTRARYQDSGKLLM